MQDKKPFWETKIGRIIGGAKEILPNDGVLGVLKNLIDSDKELTPEEKKEAHRHLISQYEIEVRDRDSARNREARIAEAGKSDIMMFITGIVGLLAFAFTIYAVVYIPEVEENPLFTHMLGMIDGVAVTIFAYYYGTSAKK